MFGLLPQSDGRLSGGVPVGDGRPVTLAAVPSLPVLLNQQLALFVTVLLSPPWSHQKSTPFGCAGDPSGAWPIWLP